MRLRGLLAMWGSKNGWQLAEHAGERTQTACSGCWPPPAGTPTWSATHLRAYVVEHLGDPGRCCGGRDGILEKGTTSVGVQRQYSGTAGKVEKRQLGVFLAYASPMGGR